MNILAFAASNSRTSINKALVTYAAGLLENGILDGCQVEILDLNDFEMPLFSVDREKEHGVPDLAQQFYSKVGSADALLVSFAEHNGFYTAAYKNLFDWTSRIDQKVFQSKPAVLLSASPGPGGGRNVMGAAQASAPHFAMDVNASLSVPSFYNNFDMATGQLTNPEIQAELETVLATFK
ncbi:MAG: NAD(P)H-dependent oxidoreductase [Chloroflexota bacterium]